MGYVLRFHLALIEPDGRLSRIRLSDKGHDFAHESDAAIVAIAPKGQRFSQPWETPRVAKIAKAVFGPTAQRFAWRTVGPLGRGEFAVFRLPPGVAQGLENGWAFGPNCVSSLDVEIGIRHPRNPASRCRVAGWRNERFPS
jgi:hypothetical protein